MIDFHCHIDLYPDPKDVAQQCMAQKLYVLSVTTTPSAWHGTVALAAGLPRIRTALGLHPQIAHERKHELGLFIQLLPDAPYIGEIGLDGTPTLHKHRDDQIFVFRSILAACRSSGGRILSIHSRRAASAVLDHLEEYRGAGTPILHWFSGTQHELKRAITLGCWFSVGPAMLAGKKGRALVEHMPRDRVLTETDGPFTQVAGQTAYPWHVEKAIEALAMVWSTPYQDTQEQIYQNLKHLVSNRLGAEPSSVE